jgi:hypothetical protein
MMQLSQKQRLAEEKCVALPMTTPMFMRRTRILFQEI